MRLSYWPIFVLCIVIISLGIFIDLGLAQDSEQENQVFIHKKIRMLEPNDPLSKAYHESLKSVEAAEEFIRTHPDEKDLCAGALLRIARIYNKKNEKNKAIDIYQKAIDEYPDELLPYANTEITVKDSAFFEMGLIEKDIGNREKAMEIFEKLGKSSNPNIRNNARIYYLLTMQSHLKLKAKVSLKKKRYSRGEEIRGNVVVRNPEKENVTFQCFVRIRRKEHLSYGAIFPRKMPKEITLKPGQEYKGTFVFTSRERLEPEKWVIDCDLNGVPVESNSLNIKISDKKSFLSFFLDIL